MLITTFWYLSWTNSIMKIVARTYWSVFPCHIQDWLFLCLSAFFLGLGISILYVYLLWTSPAKLYHGGPKLCDSFLVVVCVLFPLGSRKEIYLVSMLFAFKIYLEKAREENVMYVILLSGWAEVEAEVNLCWILITLKAMMDFLYHCANPHGIYFKFYPWKIS